MSESPTISYTLEEFLLRFEQRIDRQFSELNQRIDKLDEKMNRQYAELNQKIDKLDEKMDRQYAELNQKIDKLDEKMDRQYAELNQKISDVTGDVKALSEQVKGIDKRLETLEFVLRAGVAAFLTGAVGLLLNAFGVFSQFKQS